TLALVAVVLVLGTAISTWQAVRATRAEGLAATRLEAEKAERGQAAAAKQEAKLQLFKARLDQVGASRLSGHAGQRLKSWQAAVRFSPDGTLVAVRYASDLHVRLCDWRHGRDVFPPPFPKCGGAGWAFSPDGRRLALARSDGTITVHDTVTGREEAEPVKVGVKPTFLSYSPDGRKLAMVSWPGQEVQILDSATGHLDRQFPAPGG